MAGSGPNPDTDMTPNHSANPDDLAGGAYAPSARRLVRRVSSRPATSWRY